MTKPQTLDLTLPWLCLGLCLANAWIWYELAMLLLEG